MSLSDWVRKTVWPRRGVAGWAGYVALRPLCAVYGLGVGLRNAGYRIGLLPAREAPVPVVSVGNLTVGGTGKTPFTLWLSRGLAERGLRVGIVLRGYGGKAGGVTIVSRGAGPEVKPAEAGDEAVMLAKCFSGPVITAARRIDGARAAAELGCEAVVLDDGFQHRAIRRAFDVVLLDARRGPLLPAGPLRERLGALRRAHAVVLVDSAADGPAPDAPRAAAKKAVYRMRVNGAALVESSRGEWCERPVGLLAGQRVLVVSGIARPAGFYALVRQWEAVIDEVFEYPDHHAYTAADWQNIGRRSQRADLVVTTEKDLVKLEAFPFANGKLVALRIAACVESGDALIERIVEAVRGRREPEGGAEDAPPPAED